MHVIYKVLSSTIPSYPAMSWEGRRRFAWSRELEHDTIRTINVVVRRTPLKTLPLVFYPQTRTILYEGTWFKFVEPPPSDNQRGELADWHTITEVCVRSIVRGDIQTGITHINFADEHVPNTFYAWVRFGDKPKWVQDPGYWVHSCRQLDIIQRFWRRRVWRLRVLVSERHRMIAVAMSLHARLGSESPMQMLSSDLVERIVSYVH